MTKNLMRATITRMVGLYPVRIEIERNPGKTRLIDGKVFFDKTMKYWSTFAVDVYSTSTMNTYDVSSFAGKGHGDPHDIDAVPKDLKVLYESLNAGAHRVSTLLSRQFYMTALEAFNNGNDGGKGFRGLVQNALSLESEQEVAEILNLCPDEFIDPDQPNEILVDLLNAPMFDGLETSVNGMSHALKLGFYKLFCHIDGFEVPRSLRSDDHLTDAVAHGIKVNI